MRQIGTFDQSSDALKFASYLITQGIAAHAEEEQGRWVLWVRDEDKLSNAKEALAEFRDDPTNARYRAAEEAAEARQKEERRKREASKENTIHMRERWGSRSGIRRRPLTIAVILLCGGIGLASGLGTDRHNQVLNALLFCDPHHAATGWSDSTLEEKLLDIRQGEWWRIFTPVFLHGNAMHLAFNMMMFYQLGAMIEHRRGTWRLGLMILAIGIISNLMQALVPNAWGGTSQFLGFSGVVYGLFGYVWMKSRYQPALGMYIDRMTVGMLMVFMVLGFLGVFKAVGFYLANWAHGAGFVTGVVIALVPLLFRPSKE